MNRPNNQACALKLLVDGGRECLKGVRYRYFLGRQLLIELLEHKYNFIFEERIGGDGIICCH